MALRQPKPCVSHDYVTFRNPKPCIFQCFWALIRPEPCILHGFVAFENKSHGNLYCWLLALIMPKPCDGCTRLCEPLKAKSCVFSNAFCALPDCCVLVKPKPCICYTVLLALVDSQNHGFGFQNCVFPNAFGMIGFLLWLLVFVIGRLTLAFGIWKGHQQSDTGS